MLGLTLLQKSQGRENEIVGHSKELLPAVPLIMMTMTRMMMMMFMMPIIMSMNLFMMAT